MRVDGWTLLFGGIAAVLIGVPTLVVGYTAGARAAWITLAVLVGLLVAYTVAAQVYQWRRVAELRRTEPSRFAPMPRGVLALDGAVPA